MIAPAQCEECRAIVREFLDACAEIGANPKLKEEARTAYQALLGMVGGTEEDVERAEQFLDKYKFKAQPPESLELTPPKFRFPKIREASRRMWGHRLRTGHVPLLQK